MNQQPNCDLPSNVNFVVDEFVYNMDNIDWNIVKNQIKRDIQNTFKTGYYANNPIESVEEGKSTKALKYKVQKEDNANESYIGSNNDKMLLERLVRVYGREYIMNRIKG